MDKKLKEDLTSILLKLREENIEYFFVMVDRKDLEGGFRIERYASEVLIDRITLQLIRQKI